MNLNNEKHQNNYTKPQKLINWLQIAYNLWKDFSKIIGEPYCNDGACEREVA